MGAGPDRMTITQAAETLGISPSASPKEIQAAYRQLARKCHPDAYIGKPEGEKQLAAKRYKLLNAAKQVLLNPETAEPEQTTVSQAKEYRPSAAAKADRQAHSAVSGSSTSMGTEYRPSVHRDQPQPQQRTGAGSWATVGNTAKEREKFNRAKEFTSQFGQQKDSYEETIANEYRKYVSDTYSKPTDRMKISWSLFPTAMAIVVAVISVIEAVQESIGTGEGMPGLGMMAAFIALCAVKAISYDMVLSGNAEISGKTPPSRFMPALVGGIILCVLGAVMLGDATPWKIAVMLAATAVAAIGAAVQHPMQKKSGS